MELYMATQNGLKIVEVEEGRWQTRDTGLSGQNVTSVIAREGVILAGTDDGIYRSDDGGHRWQPANEGLAHRHIRWMAYHPDISDREFAGTEPAGIFVSQDGARSWQAVPEVARLRDQFGWYLPYSPAAGCVRSFAFHGERGYAAVEVGGVLRTDDRGQSWRLVDGSSGEPSSTRPGADMIHPDVHSIHVHPSSPDLVYAATGGGLYRSEDGGVRWKLLYRCYCRTLWVDPLDPTHIVFGPARAVDREGRIEESYDGGESWTTDIAGTNAPWAHHMLERLFHLGERFYGVLSNGDLISRSVHGETWQPVLSNLGWVQALTVMGG